MNRKRVIWSMPAGLLFILILTMVTFIMLNRFMDRETEQDIQEIARVHLQGVAGEEITHFNAVRKVRFEQMENIRAELDALENPDAASVAEALRRSAASRRFVSCVLVSESGAFVELAGEHVISYDDARHLADRLRAGETFLSCGFSEMRQIIIFALPLAVPMENGETSMGLLCMKPIDALTEMVNLTDGSSLVSFQVLREDGSYLLRNSASIGYSLYENLKDHAAADGAPIDDKVRELQSAISRGEAYMLHLLYTGDNGRAEQRIYYGVALPDSDLYLIAVMPYGGVLDQAIEDMGRSRTHGVLAALSVVTLGILLVFLLYRRTARQQIRILDEARTTAEEASARAEEEAEDASQARAVAENAMVELEAARDNAVRAREEAEKANRAKSEFLSNMSHEIRTPIHAMLGMNEMILRESGDPAVLEYADDIQRAGKTLLTLINSILDFSKIEDNQMRLLEEPYDTLSLIEDLDRLVTKDALKKGLEFRREIDPGLPRTLRGDEFRIRQIVTNLLTNAIKYTHQGSVSLRVRGAFEGGSRFDLMVSVQDTGIGIREGDMEQLFRSFHRLEEGRNRNIEGTGLGLTIVQKLLAMMGSQLEVESVYGKGSVFAFRLRQEVVDETPIGAYETEQRAGGRREKKHPDLWAPDADVLVVDDSGMNLKVARGLMKEYGIVPETADSGEKCLERVRHKQYDMIFLDHMMPGLDGVQTLARLREEGTLPDRTVVIMLTANAVVGMRERYLKEGFRDYLSKPIDMDLLEAMLTEYLPPEKQSRREEAPPSPALVVEDPLDRLSVLGFDVKTGLRYAADDRGLFLELLTSFAQDASPRIARMRDDVERQDWKDYRIQVHSLKSGAKTVGLDALSERARAQEEAAKGGRAEEILSGVSTLLRAYGTAADQIQHALGLSGEMPED